MISSENRAAFVSAAPVCGGNAIMCAKPHSHCAGRIRAHLRPHATQHATAATLLPSTDQGMPSSKHSCSFADDASNDDAIDLMVLPNKATSHFTI